MSDSKTETRTEPKVAYPEIAYREIKRRIQENELAAGFQATEKQISEMLDMSRTPIREALLRLEGDGLIELTPRHGMRVLHVSPNDMREIYQILTVLEASAVESVASNGLSDAEIVDLEQAVTDMDKALDLGDLDAWAAADQQFHTMLVGFCGNRRLAAVVNTYLDQTRRVRRLTLKLRPKPIDSNKAHAAVVDAIKRQDPDAAWIIHKKHRKEAGEMLVGLLEDIGLKHL